MIIDDSPASVLIVHYSSIIQYTSCIHHFSISIDQIQNHLKTKIRTFHTLPAALYLHSFCHLTSITMTMISFDLNSNETLLPFITSPKHFNCELLYSTIKLNPYCNRQDRELGTSIHFGEKNGKILQNSVDLNPGQQAFLCRSPVQCNSH